MTSCLPESSSDLLVPYNIYLIDPKGNLQAAKLSLDQQSFEVKIEKDETLQDLPSPKSDVKDFFDKLKRFKFIGSENSPSNSASHAIKLRRKSAASINSVSISLRNPIRISICEIQEIRLAYYDSKSNLVKVDEIKKIKPIRSGSVKSQATNLKLLKIFFGNEFNLQCNQFLVIGPDEFSSQRRPSTSSKTCQLEIWVENVLRLVTHEQSNVNYFEMLDRWYKKEFLVTEKSCNSHYGLQIWHDFLQRNHHGLPIQRIQEHLSCLANILKEYSEDHDTKPINLDEFVSIARYFTHSKQCIARIFGRTNNANLSPTNYGEDVSAEIVNMFQSYCQYIMTVEEKYLPKVSGNLGMAIVPHREKQVIKYLTEKFMKHTKSLAQEKWLSSFSILDYLYSPHNNIWSPEKQEIYQDMTRPLSHYFIASSHNTYLTGNQYKSKSSCEAYARVLRQGCRCIEIDVWNGPKNKPTVKHGNTMTTAVKLKDVLTMIKEHAFVTSPYPVIISIENHCSVKQQKVMAKYFWRIFGKMLFTGNIGDQFRNRSQLPSPEELKYRIVLKGRTLPSQVSKECGSIKNEIRSGLKRLKSISDSTGNRLSSTSGNSNVSSYVEPNSSEFLLVGELWMKTENKRWISQMFLLNSKTMLCIEEECCQRKSTRRSQLPSFPIVRQSLSLAELAQEFHQDQMWFHGQIHGGYKEVNKLFKKNSLEGSFLVWESSTLPGNFVLSIFYPNTGTLDDVKDSSDNAHHVPIESSVSMYQTNHKLYRTSRQSYQSVSEPKYWLYDSVTKFNSIYELISYYQQQPFPSTTISLKRLGPPVEISLPNTHENMEWFFKDMDRPKSEKVLSQLRIDGLFLGRYKDDKYSEIVISFRCDNQIKHCGIKRDGRYLTISNLKFRKLEELVQYYGTNSFYKNLKLRHPLTKRLYDMVIQDKHVDEAIHSTSAYLDSTVDEITCTVRAIQKYDSSDPNILSFKKGDLIVNVIKDKGGWWSGAKLDFPTERKQFCSSFVEEVDDFGCPFEGYVGKFIWKLGVKASVKTCTDKSERKDGITHYIVFEDEDGSKRKLGSACYNVAKEWLDMINVAIEHDEEMKIKVFQARDSKRHKIATELSDLILLGNTRENEALESCGDVVDGIATSRHKNNRCTFPVKSFSESLAQNTFSLDPTFWSQCHQNSLTRIYPKGLRLNSSNFSPMVYWSFGSQLVALNYQTPDKGMQINRGMFQQNGNCGYVLKPSFLLDISEDAIPCRPMSSAQRRVHFSLTIEVIGARNLRKGSPGPISPFVEIEIIGVDKDCQKAKTSRKETGLNPCWNEEFHFSLNYPDLALVQFRAYEEDSFSDKIFLGESTLPVSCIRCGYISIQLNNEFGVKLFSRLLVKVTINQSPTE